MDSPSTAARVKVDGQGRLVLPLWLRRDLVTTPGEVVLRRTADGVLITPSTEDSQVEQGPDGLPMLRVGRPVTNDEVVDAVRRERSDR